MAPDLSLAPVLLRAERTPISCDALLPFLVAPPLPGVPVSMEQSTTLSFPGSSTWHWAPPLAASASPNAGFDLLYPRAWDLQRVAPSGFFPAVASDIGFSQAACGPLALLSFATHVAISLAADATREAILAPSSRQP